MGSEKRGCGHRIYQRLLIGRKRAWERSTAISPNPTSGQWRWESLLGHNIRLARDPGAIREARPAQGVFELMLPNPFEVLGANMGCKLFVALQLEVAPWFEVAADGTTDIARKAPDA
jgi:hypothetical protein